MLLHFPLSCMGVEDRSEDVYCFCSLHSSEEVLSSTVKEDTVVNQPLTSLYLSHFLQGPAFIEGEGEELFYEG